MIAEEKKDLVDKRKLYYLFIQNLMKRDGSVTFNSSLNFGEFLEILEELSLEDECRAEWIQNDSNLKCSWCLMPPLEKNGKPYLSKRCPYCGRRMKGEN